MTGDDSTPLSTGNKQDNLTKEATKTDKFKEKPPRYWLGTVWPTLLFIALAIIITCFVCKYTGRAEWVGWIQAIGSISAIFIAFLIALYQSEKNKQQAEEQKQEDIDNLVHKIIGLIQIIHTSLQLATETIQNTEIMESEKKIDFVYYWELVQKKLKILQDFNWFDYPSFKLAIGVEAILNFQDVVVIRFNHKASECFKKNQQNSNDILSEEKKTAILLYHWLLKSNENVRELINANESFEKILKEQSFLK